VILGALLFLYTGGDGVEDILFPNLNPDENDLASENKENNDDTVSQGRLPFHYRPCIFPVLIFATINAPVCPPYLSVTRRKDVNTLEQLLELGTLYMLWDLCAFVPELAAHRNLLVAKTVFLWLSVAETFDIAPLRSKCFRVLGESLAAHFVFEQPLSIDLKEFEQFLSEQAEAPGGKKY
jgi:hypothetical protein